MIIEEVIEEETDTETIEETEETEEEEDMMIADLGITATGQKVALIADKKGISPVIALNVKIE